MKSKILIGGVAAIAMLVSVLLAADHIDAPAVTGPGSTSPGNDITDIYAFQSPADNSKMVFVLNTKGLLSPSATSTATFPADVLYEFNIDNTGDNVEDLLIQCLVQKGKMKVFGPIAATTPGTVSMIQTTGPVTEVNVTPYNAGAPNIGSANGIRVFAGPRDDPFFFDLSRFREIIAGTQTGFRNPGIDTFAGTNVMSIVVEVPKAMLGPASTINVWGETKSK